MLLANPLLNVPSYSSYDTGWGEDVASIGGQKCLGRTGEREHLASDFGTVGVYKIKTAHRACQKFNLFALHRYVIFMVTQ